MQPQTGSMGPNGAQSLPAVSAGERGGHVSWRAQRRKQGASLGGLLQVEPDATDPSPAEGRVHSRYSIICVKCSGHWKLIDTRC